MKNPLKSLGQQGVMFVVTAFLLPFVVGMSGLAVDLGNIYYHKAILQNAADAAAIGGAKVGMKDTNALDKFNKVAADKKANQLVADDKKYALSSDPELRYLKSKSKPDTVRYYVVKLKEDVPLYFLHYFLKTKQQSVSAQAQVKIAKEATGFVASPGPNLFTFRDGMQITQAIEHAGNGMPETEEINTSVDGRAIATDSKGYSCNDIYSPQNPANRAFFTAEAKTTFNNSCAKAMATHKEIVYDETTGAVKTPGYYSRVLLDEKYDMNAFWDDTIGPIAEKAIAEGKTTTLKQPTVDDLANKTPLVYDLQGMNDRNIEFTFDKAIPGDPNQPVYIILKNGDQNHRAQNLKVYVKADTVRPVIIGVSPLPKGQYHSQLQIEFTGPYTFRGVAYAPSGDQGESVHINMQRGSTFKGSLVGPYLKLQGDGHSAYTYERFTDNGGGSGGGSSSDIPTVGFDNDDSDIDFNS